MKKKIEIEVEVPDGYRAIGYRKPENGDIYYIEQTNCVSVNSSDSNLRFRYLILEKLSEVEI